MKKSLLLFLALVSFSSSFTQAVVTVGPYLQSPTTTSIKVMWRSDVAATSKVMYGTSPGTLTLTATDNNSVTQHMVAITGLQPYTKYYYAVYNDNTLGAGGGNEHYFRTFPNSSDPGHVRMWAMGDFGKGNTKQQKVRDSYLNFDTVETNLWLWLGDNVYDDGLEQEYIDKVFDSVWGYKNVMRHLPFHATPGNHDYTTISPPGNGKPPLQHTGPYFDFVETYRNAEAGGVATGHELFYSFDYRNVHFVSINSELGNLFSATDDWTGVNLFGGFTSSPMTQWLHQDLQANTKEWTVVYFHQPPYSAGSHNSSDAIERYMKAMRENFCEIIEQYGGDLVLSGHSHVYERSYLVHGSYGDDADVSPFNIIQNTSGKESLGEAYTKYTSGPNPNLGTVYVVNGNSGSSESGSPLNHPLMYTASGCDTCIGSFVLDVDSNRMVGRYLDGYGAIRDDFTIYKLALPTSIGNVSHKPIRKVKVAPNPFSNSTLVTFEVDGSDNVNMQLVDVSGRVIEFFNGKVTNENPIFEIDAEKLKLAKGVYTLLINTGMDKISHKLVIQ